MKYTTFSRDLSLLALTVFTLLPSYAAADSNVISTQGFQSCMPNSTIKVERMNVQFDRSTNRVTFDVAGESGEAQNVTASLEISAYGKQIYQKDFDPCATEVHVPELCPGTTTRLFI